MPEPKLKAVEFGVDEKTIKHLAVNYFYDKNGLYYFGGHTKNYNGDYQPKTEKLINAKNIIPRVSEKYFVFDNQVFAIDNSNAIKKLEIDPNKLIEIRVEDKAFFITDGKTIYSAVRYGYEESNRNEKGLYGKTYPTLYSGVNLQKIYSHRLKFIKEGNSIIFNKNNSKKIILINPQV